MTDPKRTGPSLQTLKHLAGMLPSMIKGHAEGKLSGKGIKVDQVPSKVCLICGQAFEWSSGAKEAAVLTEPCPKCDALLKEGFTAFISEGETGKRFAFAKAASLADLAGTVARISPMVMEKLAEQFKVEWQIIPRPGVDGHPEDGWHEPRVELPPEEPAK